MPRIRFGYYALHYLNLWIRSERAFLDAFGSERRGERLNALKAAATEFRVARTLRSHGKEGSARYEPLLRILDSQPEDLVKGKPPSDVVEIVTKIERQIAKEYGDKRKDASERSVLSATTKLLWVKFRSPIVIYDKQAREALEVSDGDLGNFYDRWHKRFRLNEPDIASACSAIATMRDYWYPAWNSLRHDEIIEVISSRWFRERVLDICLWHEGSRMGRRPSLTEARIKLNEPPTSS